MSGESGEAIFRYGDENHAGKCTVNLDCRNIIQRICQFGCTAMIIRQSFDMIIE